MITKNKPRIDKVNYYLDIAETVLERCTCLRRKFGAVIVKNDEIISTGYAGYCAREKMQIPRGERYEMCRSVHAEQNAIISAARRDLIDSTLYLVGKEAIDNSYVKNANPCILCKRFILNAGIKEVIIRKDKNNYEVIDTKTYIDNDESLDEKFGY